MIVMMMVTVLRVHVLVVGTALLVAIGLRPVAASAGLLSEHLVHHCLL